MEFVENWDAKLSWYGRLCTVYTKIHVWTHSGCTCTLNTHVLGAHMQWFPKVSSPGSGSQGLAGSGWGLEATPKSQRIHLQASWICLSPIARWIQAVYPATVGIGEGNLTSALGFRGYCCIKLLWIIWSVQKPGQNHVKHRMNLGWVNLSTRGSQVWGDSQGAVEHDAEDCIQCTVSMKDISFNISACICTLHQLTAHLWNTSKQRFRNFSSSRKCLELPTQRPGKMLRADGHQWMVRWEWFRLVKPI